MYSEIDSAGRRLASVVSDHGLTTHNTGAPKVAKGNPIQVGTPIIGTTIKPMLLGPPGTDSEGFVYPRVGEIYLMDYSAKGSYEEDGTAKTNIFATTVYGPRSRPYTPERRYKKGLAVNLTPFEYFECHHLTLMLNDGYYQILGGQSNLFIGEVTQDITDTTVGEVRLGYIPYKFIRVGDSLEDVRWMQEKVNNSPIDVKRPCSNHLAGGTITQGTKCYVQQEAGGSWLVVAVAGC